MMKRTLHTLALTALLRALPGIIKIARAATSVCATIWSRQIASFRYACVTAAAHAITSSVVEVITARSGTHKSPDVDMVFKTAAARSV